MAALQPAAPPCPPRPARTAATNIANGSEYANAEAYR